MTRLSPLLRDVVRRGPGPVRNAARVARDLSRRYRVVTIRQGPAAGMRIGLRHASNDYRDGRIEVPVQRAVASLVEPGCVFFDIGANVGFFTLVAANVVDRNATFVAFEPRRDVADALVANLRRNGIEADVWPVAVGERAGVAALMVADHPGGATIEPEKAYDTERVEHVPLVAIDDLVESGRLPIPDVVKIDVEGAEPAVLRGMVRTLQRGRTRIVYEVDAPDEPMAEAQYAEIDSILREFGYTSTRLEASYEGSGWHVIHAVASSPA